MWICLYEAASSAVITKVFFSFLCVRKIVYFIVFIIHYIIIDVFCRNNITKPKFVPFFKVKEDKRKAANIWPENEYEMTPYSCQ